VGGIIAVFYLTDPCPSSSLLGAILDPSHNVIGINTAHIMPRDKAALNGGDYNADFPNIAVPSWQFMPTYAHILQQEA